MCDAVEGRFLNEPTIEALQRAATAAQTDGLDVLFVTDGPLGDAITLAANLAQRTSSMLIGVRTTLEGQAHRHPTLLARETTTFDLVAEGRAVLAFCGPFTATSTGPVAEAIALCRGMWRDGIAASEGPHYPVAGAINRPLPWRAGGPPIALDLTDGSLAPDALLAACDLVLVPAGAAAPAALPPGTDMCHIRV
jgi:alkanesulfonate monooxygenase SsuD/methylene tetrahydromethanopterin reductase-like flavin-dependent oxidoreductase (luciferase family)